LLNAARVSALWHGRQASRAQAAIVKIGQRAHDLTKPFIEPCAHLAHHAPGTFNKAALWKRC
jgi:hypothetical protein